MTGSGAGCAADRELLGKLRPPRASQVLAVPGVVGSARSREILLEEARAVADVEKCLRRRDGAGRRSQVAMMRRWSPKAAVTSTVPPSAVM